MNTINITEFNYHANALEQLKLLRARCKIGDVISPLEEVWDADLDAPMLDINFPIE